MAPYSQKILATLLEVSWPSTSAILCTRYRAVPISQYSHPNAVDSLVSRLFFHTGRLGTRLHPASGWPTSTPADVVHGMFIHCVQIFCVPYGIPWQKHVVHFLYTLWLKYTVEQWVDHVFHWIPLMIHLELNWEFTSSNHVMKQFWPVT